MGNKSSSPFPSFEAACNLLNTMEISHLKKSFKIISKDHETISLANFTEVLLIYYWCSLSAIPSFDGNWHSVGTFLRTDLDRLTVVAVTTLQIIVNFDYDVWVHFFTLCFQEMSGCGTFISVHKKACPTSSICGNGFQKESSYRFRGICLCSCFIPCRQHRR